MVALAKKRNAGGNRVTFIADDIENATIGNNYDVILTPFLFDNFTDDRSRKLFLVLNESLSAKGIWLYCDFQNTPSLWHGVLLRTMYFILGCVVASKHGNFRILHLVLPGIGIRKLKKLLL